MDSPKNSYEHLSDAKRRSIALTWNKPEEELLQTWAERASGWAWLHDKSQRYYAKQSNYLMYPSIILNTITGGIGFLSSSNFLWISYIIACMNIFSAILISFQKFLSSFSVFSSFTRKISLELALNPEDRVNCIYFCKQCRIEYDKAVSESPIIPESVILQFKIAFPHAINKPEVANGLFHFNNYPEINTDIL